MDTFLARQPVFDRDLAVFGYEMSFSDGTEKVFDREEGDAPNAKLVEQTLHEFGVPSLTQGRKTFVRMTPALIRKGIAALLPVANSIIQIPGEAAGDAAIVEACRSLKSAGYTLALEDYWGDPSVAPLVPLADLLKVDFTRVTAANRGALIDRHQTQAKLLAQNVESHTEFREAAEQGYAFFQGPFFAKPELLVRRTLSPAKVQYLQILSEVNRPDCDFDQLEKLVRQDVGLSVKLLRYINSAIFGLKGRVENMKQALTLLGLVLLKKWVSLLSITAMGDEKPQELVVTSLVRARFCEEFGKEAKSEQTGFDLFMAGMFSCLDALLDRPMAELLRDLPLSEQVKEALQGSSAGPGKLLGLIKCYERADWHRLATFADGYPVAMKQIPRIYRESVAWAHQVFNAAA